MSCSMPSHNQLPERPVYLACDWRNQGFSANDLRPMDNDTLVIERFLYIKFKIGGAYAAPIGWLSATFRVKNRSVENQIHMGAFFSDDLDDLSFIVTLIHL